jgi:hypothetical protein
MMPPLVLANARMVRLGAIRVSLRAKQGKLRLAIAPRLLTRTAAPNAAAVAGVPVKGSPLHAPSKWLNKEQTSKFSLADSISNQHCIDLYSK